MKLNILLLLILVAAGNLLHAQEPIRILVETSLIDQLMLITTDSTGDTSVISISAYRKSEGGYMVSIDQPKQTSFRVDCKGCKKPISFRIGDPAGRRAMDYVQLMSGEEISFSRCMELSHPIRENQEPQAWIKAFLVESFNGRISSARRPVLMGGPDPTEPQLAFYQSDSIALLESNDLSVKWVTYKPIKEIYIISHSYQMVLESTDPDEASRWLGKKMVSPKSLPEYLFSGANHQEKEEHPDPPEEEGPKLISQYTINYRAVKEYLKKIKYFRKGEFYQMGIKLEDDKSDHNPYLFNFYLYKVEELKNVEEWLGDIR